MEFGHGHRTDRISKLSNEVLCHILSFLPTKYAVRTSILSTRWKCLFASIPSMDFDDSLFLPHQARIGNRASKNLSFVSVVDRMFLLRKLAYIDRFRLKCGKNTDTSHMNVWIYAALWRNIRELDLCVPTDEFTRLPGDLFISSSLMVLKLNGEFAMNLPIKVCLPNLKILHLNGNAFPNDNSIQRLVSSCPVLEDLVMLGCPLDNIRIINISAPTLKSLTIDFSIRNWKGKVVLNAPKLVYLKYMNFSAESYMMNNLQSLVEASIDVGIKGLFSDYVESYRQLLGGIAKVRFLYLSGHVFKDLGHFDKLPTFSNLTHLELGMVGYMLALCFKYLLESLPILETLTFVEGLFKFDREECDFAFPLEVPHCVLFYLKTINIKSFKGSKAELDVVKYFLENASVLKKLTIKTWPMVEKEELQLSKELLTLPRGSIACQVVMLSCLDNC